jgi:hypothetical protein
VVSESADQPPTAPARPDRVSRYAPLSGLVVFVLFTVGNLLWSIDIPATDAPAGELVGFYEDRSTQIVVGASLSMVSIVLFVWFSALLRDQLELELGDRGTSLPTAAFGGAVMAFTVGLGAETINMAGALRAASDGGIGPNAAQAYFDISQILGFNAAGVGLATMIAATALAALRGSRLLPRPLAIPALILALTLLVPGLVRITLILAILLLPLYSIRLYRLANEAGTGTTARIA